MNETFEDYFTNKYLTVSFGKVETENNVAKNLIDTDDFLRALDEAPSVKSKEIIKGMPVIVSLNGKAYTLNPTNESDYREIIRSHVESSLAEVIEVLKGQVREFASRLQERIDEVDEQLANKYPPPPSLEFIMNNDIQIAIKDSVYYFILPFNYNPQLLNGRKLSHSEKLSREVLIFFGYQTDGQGRFILRTVELRNYDLSPFQHYHGHEANKDCWGNYTLPKGSSYEVKRLPELRDKLQNALENINGYSLLNGSPKQLPNAEYLNASSRSVIWS